MKSPLQPDDRRPDGLAKWASADSPYNPWDEAETRDEFKHDDDEITYSRAFRRLSHKSQIVVRSERYDHFRSRLTHTLEVNQIAESIASRLGLNITLINSTAFGHDIGHCPFGHAGEREFQHLMRSDVLPLCDADRLVESIRNEYGADIKSFEENNKPINGHWLFHHAINSVRLMDRKLNGITKQTKDGVLRHSWSPWQTSSKFGVPPSYEGQAVAIADQVAGINHDTEDILSCPESEHSKNGLRDLLPEYVSRRYGIPYKAVEDIRDKWFLPRSADPGNGWGRKKRLQTITNSVVETSISLLRNHVPSEEYPITSLAIADEIGKFLDAYEHLIRETVIQGVSWFRHRDALAGSVIRTAYNFFLHYGRKNDTLTGSEDFQRLARQKLEEYNRSISDDAYDRDRHYGIFMGSVLDNQGPFVDHALRTMDYVACMTDTRIMEIHDIALHLFR